MALELKFCKFDNTPWGFRLTGGADFDLPLTVIKVTEGSLAEQVGLQVDDVIVKINDTEASNLSHTGAHEVILLAGNNFVMGIHRGDISQLSSREPIILEPEPPAEIIKSQIDLVKEVSPEKSPQICDDHLKSLIGAVPELGSVSEAIQSTEDTCKEQTIDGTNVTDEQIAEMISGEAEVLKDQNVLGVNFNKFIPKYGVIKGSDVFKTLNEEAIKTKEEKDQEVRKWSTFLQKPKKPVPKPKKDEVSEVIKAPPYKVQIIKQPTPKVSPKYKPPTPIPSPEPEPPVVEPEAEHEPEESQSEQPLPSETEVSLEEGDHENQSTDEHIEEIKEDEAHAEQEDEEIQEILPEVDVCIEEQLAQVQSQLLALAKLPGAIQSTLEAVTKQLATLVPPPRPAEPTPDITQEQEVDEEIENQDQVETELEHLVESSVDGEEHRTESENIETPEAHKPEPTPEELEKLRIEEEQRKAEEDVENKKQKVKHWNHIWPWSDKKLGRIYRDSNCHLMDSKAEVKMVNFLKYERPSKTLGHLENSAVYRMVHSLDEEPHRGVVARPEIILAERDILDSISPQPPAQTAQ